MSFAWLVDVAIGFMPLFILVFGVVYSATRGSRYLGCILRYIGVGGWGHAALV